MSQICPRFGRKRHETSPSRGLFCSTPWWNELDSGHACQPYKVSCSSIPGRGCFGDLPGDGIVVSLPPPIVGLDALDLVQFFQ